MADLLAALRAVLGESGLLTDAAAKLVYAQDASHLHLGRPLAVALPATATEAAQVVRLCAEAGVAVVSRGSGTGLSGGAVPDDGQVVLSLSRLRALGPVDVDGAQVTAGAGVLNEDVTRHAAPCGLHFAPDPSSQSAASIGGNVAENAGGPHCLRYGVTLQHVLALDWVDAAGTRHRTGPAVALHRGLDLVSLLCGSEGTLGVITAADLALTRTEPACGTLLAFFDDLAAATSSVVRLLGSGLLPVAMEIVDQPMLQAVEAAFGFGFSTTAAAALITEFTGSEPSVTHDVEVARSLLADGGAGEVRLARDEAERLDLWKCRKKAFGAVGRLAPSYVTMDVVVPVGELPGLVGDIHRIQQAHDVHVATAFHAGDGNLHPGVHYDDRDPDQTRRAHIAADEIIAAALARGGSVTGEHGVGIEKLHALPWQLDAICADLQRGVAVAFDPRGRLNPGKALPPADGQFADLPPAPTGIDLRAESLIVSAPADAPMADLQAQALEHGLWLPVGIFGQAEPGTAGLGRGGTVGQLVEQLLPGPSLLAAGTARTYLLEYWGTTGDGRTFRSGAPVFKNVAGYALGPALCGSDDVFARCQGATFQLKPAPALVGLWRLTLPESGEAATVRIRALWQDLLIRDPGWGAAHPDHRTRLRHDDRDCGSGHRRRSAVGAGSDRRPDRPGQRRRLLAVPDPPSHTLHRDRRPVDVGPSATMVPGRWHLDGLFTPAAGRGPAVPGLWATVGPSASRRRAACGCRRRWIRRGAGTWNPGWSMVGSRRCRGL